MKKPEPVQLIVCLDSADMNMERTAQAPLDNQILVTLDSVIKRTLNKNMVVGDYILSEAATGSKNADEAVQVLDMMIEEHAAPVKTLPSASVARETASKTTESRPLVEPARKAKRTTSAASRLKPGPKAERPPVKEVSIPTPEPVEKSKPSTDEFFAGLDKIIADVAKDPAPYILGAVARKNVETEKIVTSEGHTLRVSGTIEAHLNEDLSKVVERMPGDVEITLTLSAISGTTLRISPQQARALADALNYASGGMIETKETPND